MLTMNKKGFASLIGMLLTLVIISFLIYILLNTYLKPTIVDHGTSNYKSIADSVRNRVEELNKKSLEQTNQLENLTP